MLDVIDVLSDLFILRGIPTHIRSDNGPECIAKALREWIATVGAKTAYIMPASPQVRSQLIGVLGRTVYLALYSLASTLVLIWLFALDLKIDYVELWPPAAWQAAVNFVLSTIGLFLVIAGLLSPNRYSVTLRKPTGGHALLFGVDPLVMLTIH